MEISIKQLTGRRVFFYFLAFFLVIIIANIVFIYLALESRPGVVEESAYEKGLAYNKIIAQAEKQQAMDIQQEASFSDGVLSWRLSDSSGKPIEDAEVSARFLRPTKEGFDFNVALSHKGGGLYSANIDAPLKGEWTAKLEAKWNTTVFGTTERIIIP